MNFSIDRSKWTTCWYNIQDVDTITLDKYMKCSGNNAINYAKKYDGDRDNVYIQLYSQNDIPIAFMIVLVNNKEKIIIIDEFHIESKYIDLPENKKNSKVQLLRDEMFDSVKYNFNNFIII